jgi:hypothetical protein
MSCRKYLQSIAVAIAPIVVLVGCGLEHSNHQESDCSKCCKQKCSMLECVNCEDCPRCDNCPLNK